MLSGWGAIPGDSNSPGPRRAALPACHRPDQAADRRDRPARQPGRARHRRADHPRPARLHAPLVTAAATAPGHRTSAPLQRPAPCRNRNRVTSRGQERNAMQPRGLLTAFRARLHDLVAERYRLSEFLHSACNRSMLLCLSSLSFEAALDGRVNLNWRLCSPFIWHRIQWRRGWSSLLIWPRLVGGIAAGQKLAAGSPPAGSDAGGPGGMPSSAWRSARLSWPVTAPRASMRAGRL